MLSQLSGDSSKQAKQLTIWLARIASKVYPNQQFSLVQSGRTRDRGANSMSVPTKLGWLATMYWQ